MLRARDFVVFSDDWGRHPFSCQHLMRHFLPENRILWVNTIGMRLPRFTAYDVKRAFEKLASWTRKPVPASLPQGLRIVSPFMAPFNTVPAVRALNRLSVIRNVRGAMERWAMRRPILLTTLPQTADYVGALGAVAVVYYCVDDFANWPDMNAGSLIRTLEEDLLGQADLVVATSEHLARTRFSRNGQTRLLTHGVDAGHFGRARQPQDRPVELPGLQGPVVGFFGLLDNRMDWDLVRRMLHSRPEWNFLFIGNAQVPLEGMARFPNFRHLSAVSYDELPRYAAVFDAAILPYVVDVSTAGINPLKLKEYLAMGIPVVTTDLPGVAEYRDVLYVSDGPASFADTVAEALREGPRPFQAERVRSESWEGKAGQMSDWIEAIVNRNGVSL